MYKKLEIDFDIPDELSEEIDIFLETMNSGDVLIEDCYQTEINVILNWCRRDHILKDDQIDLLKDYYVWGGMHKGESDGSGS